MRIAKNKNNSVLMERDNGEATFITCSGGVYRFIYSIEETIAKFPEEEWTVVYEDPEPVPPLPKEGDYIRATLRDGRTLEGAVGGVDEVVLHHEIKIGQDLAFIGGEEHPRDIVSWEPVQKPWAVGDLVPEGTVVGKEWLGRTDLGGLSVLNATDYSTFDRTIVGLGE